MSKKRRSDATLRTAKAGNAKFTKVRGIEPGKRSARARSKKKGKLGSEVLLPPIDLERTECRITLPLNGATVGRNFQVQGFSANGSAQIRCTATKLPNGQTIPGQPSPQSGSGWNFTFSVPSSGTYRVDALGGDPGDTITVNVQ